MPAWRAPQALRRLITHFDDALDHLLSERLGRMLARP
jgi:hypothetical protein